MTLKQRMFVKRYLQNGGNGTQAAMDVYDAKNYNTAHAISVENLQKPTIKREIELAMEAKGLTDEYISELLREATVVGLGNKASNSDSLRGIDMMLKLKDAYPTQKTAHLRVDYQAEHRARLERMSIPEIQGEIKKLDEKTKQILEDSNS